MYICSNLPVASSVIEACKYVYRDRRIDRGLPSVEATGEISRSNYNYGREILLEPFETFIKANF